MKCPKCEGRGKCQYIDVYGNPQDIWLECELCSGKGYLTNDEWRHTCSAEEFAEFLSDVVFNAIVDYRIDKNNCEKEDGNYWLKWLKQPHKPIS